MVVMDFEVGFVIDLVKFEVVFIDKIKVIIVNLLNNLIGVVFD